MCSDRGIPVLWEHKQVVVSLCRFPLPDKGLGCRYPWGGCDTMRDLLGRFTQAALQYCEESPQELSSWGN